MTVAELMAQLEDRIMELSDAEQIELLKVKALDRVATQVKYLGTGDTGSQMGATEFLATEIREGLESIARAIGQVAESINASTLAQRGRPFAEELTKERDAKRKQTAGRVVRVGEGG